MMPCERRAIEAEMIHQNSLEQELAEWNAVIEVRPNDASAFVRRGMAYFKLAKISESIRDFDRAEQLEPRLTPYLWQRGLSYYYAERFEEGAKQFEVDLKVNSQDVEETVWRYLCQARTVGAAVARDCLLPVRNDPRPVMRRVYDFYAGNCTSEDLVAAGNKEGDRGNFYSNLYLGLYWEAAGDLEKSRSHVAEAVEYELDDYMWHLARVHLSLRGWV